MFALKDLYIFSQFVLLGVMSNVPSNLRAHARTQDMRLAHTRKLGTHMNFSLKNVFCTLFDTCCSKYR